MNGALEAVEGTGDTLLSDRECLVVVIAAKIALGHDFLSMKMVTKRMHLPCRE